MVFNHIYVWMLMSTTMPKIWLEGKKDYASCKDPERVMGGNKLQDAKLVSCGPPILCSVLKALFYIGVSPVDDVVLANTGRLS